MKSFIWKFMFSDKLSLQSASKFLVLVIYKRRLSSELQKLYIFIRLNIFILRTLWKFWFKNCWCIFFFRKCMKRTYHSKQSDKWAYFKFVGCRKWFLLVQSWVDVKELSTMRKVSENQMNGRSLHCKLTQAI